MKLTTASKITVARIVLIPVVLALMYWDFPGHMYCALAVFILASLSDFVDGYIARHCNQVSNFGKFMDPLADKLLVISVMLVYLDWGYIPAWAAIIVVARELAVTGLQPRRRRGRQGHSRGLVRQDKDRLDHGRLLPHDAARARVGHHHLLDSRCFDNCVFRC